MTGNLFTKIQIPVRPQIQTHQNNTSVPAPSLFKQNDTFSKFDYPAAIPLSKPNTTPKGITQDPPRGRLVNETFLQSMKSTVKSYGDYCKYFYNAGFKGTGTDYSVGKINDLAIRVGSLGIAVTLASSKFFPFARGMEFVGLGTWFAAMAAWPKLLAMPIKAKTGIDPSLKYEDSQGRRKSFFEDRQYLCFDLFKHVDKNGNYNPNAPEYELFDLIGDKLGIPRNIPNRREAIQNKVAQYGVQYNTLTMLTAGVMTPVLSSLVADQLQMPLGKALEVARVKKSGFSINNISNKIDKLLSMDKLTPDKAIDMLGVSVNSKFASKLDKLTTTAEKDSAIYLNHKQEQELSKLFENRYFGTGFGTGIIQELNTESVIVRNSVPINHELGVDVGNVSKTISEKAKEIEINSLKEKFAAVESAYKKLNTQPVENPESLKISDMINTLKTSKKGHTASIRALIATVSEFENLGVSEFKTALSEADITKLKLEHLNIDTTLSLQEIWRALDDAKKCLEYPTYFTPIGQKYATAQLQIVFSEKLKSLNLPDKDISLFNKVFETELTNYFNTTRNTLIRPQQAKNLFKIAEINLELKKRIDSYKAATIKDVAESITARSWDKIPKQYFSAIGFTPEEIESLATVETNRASEILSNRLSELVKDEAKLNKAVTEMAKHANTAITKEQKALQTLLGTPDRPGILVKTENLTKKLIAQNSFTDELKLGFERYFISNMKTVRQKVANTIDSFCRPIQILDIFKSLNVTLEPIMENNVAVGEKMVSSGKIPFILEDFLGKTSKEFMDKMSVDSTKKYNEIPNPRYGKYYTFNEAYDEAGAYKKAFNSLIDYIKDIALQKNDISDWITKHEAQPEGFSKGIKHSKHMVGVMADTIFAKFSNETRNAIEQGAEGLADILENQKAEMKRCFLGADSVIVRHSNFDGYEANKCSGKDISRIVDEFFNAAGAADAEQKSTNLLQLVENRRLENESFKNIQDAKNIIFGYINHLKNGGGFDKQSAKNFLNGILNGKCSNKDIGEMTGKNTVDFMVRAAQNIRSRNKWKLLVWSLFAATVGISLVTIANMGHTNSFNPDHWKKANKNGDKK